MDSVFGFVGADYVLLAAESSHSRSVLKMKIDEDKIMPIGNFKLLAACGEAGDRTNFCEYVKGNIVLNELRQNISLSVHAVANWARTNLAIALRSNPYNVNILIGGYDKDQGESLYFLDYLASLHKMDFACQGFASHFLLSLFDKNYRKGMSLEEGIQLVHMCVQQMRTRFVLDSDNWIIKVVSKDGIRVLENTFSSSMSSSKLSTDSTIVTVMPMQV